MTKSFDEEIDNIFNEIEVEVDDKTEELTSDTVYNPMRNYLMEKRGTPYYYVLEKYENYYNKTNFSSDKDKKEPNFYATLDNVKNKVKKNVKGKIKTLNESIINALQRIYMAINTDNVKKSEFNPNGFNDDPDYIDKL